MQGIESSESHPYNEGDIDLDWNDIDSNENLESLLESLGLNLSNEMDFDESAGLDEGLEEIENADNNDMDIEEDCNLSQMLDVSDSDDGEDSEPLLNLDNLGGSTLGEDSILGTCLLPKSDIQILIHTVSCI